MNKTRLGFFLALNWCIYFIIEFYSFVSSGVSCCKFWQLDYVKLDMLQVCYKKEIKLLAYINCPLFYREGSSLLLFYILLKMIP